MTTETMNISPLIPNHEFSHAASDERLAAVAEALRGNGMATIVVPDAEAAREQVLDLLPPGAEVFTATSATLTATGLAAAINESGRYEAVRARFAGLDPTNPDHRSEMRKLGTAPDYVVGSVHAITEQGEVMVVSYGGSQLAPYVYGAGHVIWVVGSQKLVADLDEGMRRVREYCYPLEDARLRGLRGMPSGIGKVLIVNHEAIPGRITVVLIKEALGF
ncbi:MAG: LUD domain-containing protein [Chloroflexia bacterium]